MPYLIGLFDNLMEGCEDAESTTMVVEMVRGEWDRGTRRQTDIQTGSQCRYRTSGFRLRQTGDAEGTIN